MPSRPADGEPRADAASGQRLAAQSRQLELLLHHLAGPAIRSRVEIDDLVQEVFLRALAASSGLPEPEPGDVPLRRFLARIARNTVVDVARAIRSGKRQGREVRLDRSDWSRAGALDPMARTPGPATRAVAAETERHLARAFGSLAADHRRVIGLRQFESLSAADTARRMGRSETAVHSLYRRALEAWERAAARERAG